ncbi:MAG: class I SAM-dependent methyltransferase [Christensenellales bacterium]|jgi:SAM-dependent methyltransferase
MDLRLKFDEDAPNYDRWRPAYAAELFRDIIGYSQLDSAKRALEIGMGTGQATLPILQTGCSVTAVEIGRGLAEYARRKFAASPGLEVINIDFESFEAGNSRFDLIYSATAFHWIPQELGLAKAYGLLKPGGTLALFWNHAFVNRRDDPLHVEIQKAYDKYRPPEKPLREFDESACKAYADKLAAFGFAEVTARIYRQTRSFNARDYIALLNTYSDHRALPGHVKGALESEIAQAIQRAGDELTIYDTMDLYLARKP